MVKFGKEFYGKIWPRRVPRERNPRNASRQSARIRLMPWTPIIMQDWRIRIWRTYRGGFGPRVDRERGVAEGRGGEVAQGCKTPWNYQQSLPSPCGWMGGTDSVHSAPLDHRPTGYLSCLLVYEIQHCYLAPHRRVLGTVRPLVSAEFPTLKGRVLVRDFTVTYPRFFLPCTIVFNQAGRHVLERERVSVNWTREYRECSKIPLPKFCSRKRFVTISGNSFEDFFYPVCSRYTGEGLNPLNLPRTV